MSAAASAPAETFASIIAWLCRVVAAAAVGRGLPVPVLLLWPRLMRLSGRFARLAARIAAGERPGPSRPRAPAVARERKPYQRLPRRFGWLLSVPEARASGSKLAHLLAQPAMADILADPRSGRLLRPLCRMLGVRLPPALILPLRPARRSATPARRAAARQGPPCGPPEPAPLAVVPSRAGPRRKLT